VSRCERAQTTAMRSDKSQTAGVISMVAALLMPS
jgi:hypothetical protein